MAKIYEIEHEGKIYEIEADDDETLGQVTVAARQQLLGGSPGKRTFDEPIKTNYPGRTPEMGDPSTSSGGIFSTDTLAKVKSVLDRTPAAMPEVDQRPPSVSGQELDARAEFKKAITPNYITGEGTFGPQNIAGQFSAQKRSDANWDRYAATGKYLELPGGKNVANVVASPIDEPAPVNPLRQRVQDYRNTTAGQDRSPEGTQRLIETIGQDVYQNEPRPEDNIDITGVGSAAARFLDPNIIGRKLASGSVNVGRSIANLPRIAAGAAENLAPGIGKMTEDALGIEPVKRKMQQNLVTGKWEVVEEERLPDKLDNMAKFAQNYYLDDPQMKAIQSRATEHQNDSLLDMAKFYATDPGAAAAQSYEQVPQFAAMALTGGESAIAKAAAFAVPIAMESLETFDAAKEYEKQYGVKIDPTLRDTLALGKGLVNGLIEKFGFDTAIGKTYERLSPQGKLWLLKRIATVAPTLGPKAFGYGMAMATESATEGIQQVVGNYAQRLGGFGGNDLSEGVNESMIIAAILGGGTHAAAGAAGMHQTESVGELQHKALVEMVKKDEAARMEFAMAMPDDVKQAIAQQAAKSGQPAPVTPPVTPPNTPSATEQQVIKGSMIPPADLAGNAAPVAPAPAETAPVAPPSATPPVAPEVAQAPPVAPPVGQEPPVPMTPPAAPPAQMQPSAIPTPPIPEQAAPVTEAPQERLIFRTPNGQDVPVEVIGRVGNNARSIRLPDGSQQTVGIGSLSAPDGTKLAPKVEGGLKPGDWAVISEGGTPMQVVGVGTNKNGKPTAIFERSDKSRWESANAKPASESQIAEHLENLKSKEKHAAEREAAKEENAAKKAEVPEAPDAEQVAAKLQQDNQFGEIVHKTANALLANNVYPTVQEIAKALGVKTEQVAPHWQTLTKDGRIPWFKDWEAKRTGKVVETKSEVVKPAPAETKPAEVKSSEAPAVAQEATAKAPEITTPAPTMPETAKAPEAIQTPKNEVSTKEDTAAQPERKSYVQKGDIVKATVDGKTIVGSVVETKGKGGADSVLDLTDGSTLAIKTSELTRIDKDLNEIPRPVTEAKEEKPKKPRQPKREKPETSKTLAAATALAREGEEGGIPGELKKENSSGLEGSLQGSDSVSGIEENSSGSIPSTSSAPAEIAAKTEPQKPKVADEFRGRKLQKGETVLAKTTTGREIQGEVIAEGDTGKITLKNFKDGAVITVNKFDLVKSIERPAPEAKEEVKAPAPVTPEAAVAAPATPAVVKDEYNIGDKLTFRNPSGAERTGEITQKWKQKDGTFWYNTLHKANGTPINTTVKPNMIVGAVEVRPAAATTEVAPKTRTYEPVRESKPVADANPKAEPKPKKEATTKEPKEPKPKKAKEPKAVTLVTSTDVDVTPGKIVTFKTDSGELVAGKVIGPGRFGGISVGYLNTEGTYDHIILDQSKLLGNIDESLIPKIEETKPKAAPVEAKKAEVAPSILGLDHIQNLDHIAKADGKITDKVKEIAANLKTLPKTAARGSAIAALQGGQARLRVAFRTIGENIVQLQDDVMAKAIAKDDAAVSEMLNESPAVKEMIEHAAKIAGLPIHEMVKSIIAGLPATKNAPVYAIYKKVTPHPSVDHISSIMNADALNRAEIGNVDSGPKMTGIVKDADGSLIFVDEPSRTTMRVSLEEAAKLMQYPHLTAKDIDNGLFEVDKDVALEAKRDVGREGSSIMKSTSPEQMIPVARVSEGGGANHGVVFVSKNGQIMQMNAAMADHYLNRGAKVYSDGNVVADGKIIGTFTPSFGDSAYNVLTHPSDFTKRVAIAMVGGDAAELGIVDDVPTGKKRVIKAVEQAKTWITKELAGIFSDKRMTQPISFEDTHAVIRAFQSVYGDAHQIIPVFSTDDIRGLESLGLINTPTADDIVDSMDNNLGEVGRFMPDSGHTIVIMPTINNSAMPMHEMIKTLVHEYIGHYGMARMMSDPDAYLDRVWDDHKLEILNDKTFQKAYAHIWRLVDKSPMTPAKFLEIKRQIDAIQDVNLQNSELSKLERHRRDIAEEWVNYKTEDMLTKRVMGEIGKPPAWYEKLIVGVRDFINKVIAYTGIGKSFQQEARGVRFVDVERMLANPKLDKNGKIDMASVAEDIRTLLKQRAEGFTLRDAVLREAQGKENSATFYPEVDNSMELHPVMKELVEMDQSVNDPGVIWGAVQQVATNAELNDLGVTELLYSASQSGRDITPSQLRYLLLNKTGGVSRFMLNAGLHTASRGHSYLGTEAAAKQRKIVSSLNLDEATAEKLSKIDDRLSEAQGINNDSRIVDTIKEVSSKMWAGITQAYPELHTTTRSIDAIVNDHLRLLNDSSKYAAQVAINAIREITGSQLTVAEESYMGKLLAMRDVVAEVGKPDAENIYLDVALPYGIPDAETAKTVLANLEDKVAKEMPNVAKALARREVFMKQFTDMLVSEGLLEQKPGNEPSTYFRRQVLKYYEDSDAAERMWGSKGKLLANKHGMFKARTGPGKGSVGSNAREIRNRIADLEAKAQTRQLTKEESESLRTEKKQLQYIQADFNTKYREMEFEHIAAGFHQLRTLAIVKSMREKIDAGPVLKANAKHANLVTMYGSPEEYSRITDLKMEKKRLTNSKEDKKRRKEINADLAETDPLHAAEKKFAVGLSMLGKSLVDNIPGDIPSEYEELANSLALKGMSKAQRDEVMANAEEYEAEHGYLDVEEGSLFGLMKWLDAKYPNQYGGIGAIYQSLADKAAAIREGVEAAGEQFQTADTLASNYSVKDIRGERGKLRDTKPIYGPEELVPFSPDDKHIMHQAMTVNDRLLNNILKQLEDNKVDGVDPEAMAYVLQKAKPMLAFGPLREKWYIPKNVAHQLNEYGKADATNVVGRAAGKVTNTWKIYTLHAPWRFVKYNINNMTGDLDAILASYPGALKYLPKAFVDLTRFYGNRGRKKFTRDKVTLELEDLVSRGVLDAGMSSDELTDLGREILLSSGQKMFDKNDIPASFMRYASEFKHPIDLAGKLWQGYWGKAQTYSRVRESLLRLALQRYLADVYAKTGNLPMGGSPGGELRMIKAGYEEAAKRAQDLGHHKKAEAIRKQYVQTIIDKVSRETMGDYGNISHFGQSLRKFAIPFWSWSEVNAPRYFNIVRNTIAGDKTMLPDSLVKRLGAVGALKAVRGAVFFLKAHLIMGMLMGMNHFAHKDEEDELGASRSQLHLILGRDAEGYIRTLRLQGAMSDVYGWVGLENATEDIDRLKEGEVTKTGLAFEAAKSVASRLINGGNPFVKGLSEGVFGQKTYPSIFMEGEGFERRRSYTRGGVTESMINSVFGPFAEAINSRLSKTPQRKRDLSEWLLTYKTDPGEQAYWDTKSLISEYVTKTGKGNQPGGAAPSTKPSQVALYNFRKAVQYDWPELQDYWAAEFFKSGGTPKGLSTSIQKTGPLDALNLMERKEWWDQATPAQRKQFNLAAEWYKKQGKKLEDRAKEMPEYKEGLRQEKVGSMIKARSPRLPKGADPYKTFIPGVTMPGKYTQ